MEEKRSKTKSQRLRAVLYLLWEIEKKEGETAEQFYEEKMEAIIQWVKRKLPKK